MPKTDHRVNLTDSRVRSLKPAPEGKRYQIMDAQVPGFGVRVTDGGTKTFILRTRYPGSDSPARRELGRVGVMTLADAREKANIWRGLVAKGIDPSIQEERDRAAEVRKIKTTFGSVAEDFIKDKLPFERKRVDVEKEIRRELMPAWESKPIADIADVDVLTLVKAKARKFKIAAKNLFALIKRFFRWAVAQRIYGITTSPCATLSAKDIIGDVSSIRDRILSSDELTALWRASGELPYPYGPVYRLLTLTALRLREVANAEWTEFHADVVRALRNRKKDEHIDWSKFSAEQLIWIIPAQRMKGKDTGSKKARPHTVPLTAEILSVVEELPIVKNAKFVFSTTAGEKPAWMGGKVKDNLDAHMLKVLREIAEQRAEDPRNVELAPFVNHDIRRSVRSHLSRLKISEEAREAVLAHVRPGIKGVYDIHDYLDEKREALELWTARLHNIVEPAPSNVVPMRVVE
jgi:hypothetical protein